MKTSTMPPQPVDPEQSEAAEGGLQEGEASSGFIEAPIQDVRRAGPFTDSDVVHAELAKTLAKAKARLQGRFGA